MGVMAIRTITKAKDMPNKRQAKHFLGGVPTIRPTKRGILLVNEEGQLKSSWFMHDFTELPINPKRKTLWYQSVGDAIYVPNKFKSFFKWS